MPSSLFLRLQVAERPLDRLLHRARDAAGHLELARARRERHLEAVQADRAVGRHAGGVDGPGRQRIGRDQVAAALLGHADEPLLAGLVAACS